jgi:hypothetical protein
LFSVISGVSSSSLPTITEGKIILADEFSVEDRALVDQWLETHRATKIPDGVTTLRNDVPKKKMWGGGRKKVKTEEPIPTTFEDDEQQPKTRRGRPKESEENINSEEAI